MGSMSDMPVMEEAARFLDQMEIPFEMNALSAHRTPDKVAEYAKSASQRGVKVIIAGAGGASHLPGMVASITTLPVIGVPVKSSNSIDGWDSVLSILQMPGGVPVGTLAIGASGAKNAGLLAAAVVGLQDEQVASRLEAHRQAQTEAVAEEPVEDA